MSFKQRLRRLFIILVADKLSPVRKQWKNSRISQLDSTGDCVYINEPF